MQRLQSLVTFRDAALVKANIVSSLRGSALKEYTSELSDFDWNTLNNNPGVNNWVNILSHCFKAPTSVALGLFTNETYSLDGTRTQQPSAQYVCTILQYEIECNIIDIANQLSFAY